MSFPGTYNISYYYGDTLEFRVYPKNSSGEVFDLSEYTLSRFTLAPTRTSAESEKISCFASFSSDRTNVLCVIRPEDSEKLNPDITYVYDVEVSKPGTPYPTVYTLLNGSVSITRDITKPTTNLITETPNNPQNLVLQSQTSSTLSVFWTPPATGGPVQSYRYAIIPFTTNTETLEAAITNSTSFISGLLTEFTFFDLQENTDYSIILRSNNSAGDASISTILTNTTAFRTADNPLTVEPDIFVSSVDSTEFIIDGVSNPTLTLIRGETYVINVDSPNHPFWIQFVEAPFDAGSVVEEGILNNGTQSGNIIFSVSSQAQSTLYYVAENSVLMSGVINVIDGES